MALKGINGVESVDVSLNKGLATVTLRPGNNVTMEQLQHAITKNGFTTKQSTISVVGMLFSENGRLELRVSGSNESFHLVPQNQQTADFRQLNGKTVSVEGVVPEIAKDKKADTIEFRSLTGV